jgi:hypothetical protein
LSIGGMSLPTGTWTTGEELGPHEKADVRREE